jgi:hypothetical protein
MNRFLSIAIAMMFASQAAMAQSEASSQASSQASTQSGSESGGPSNGWPLIDPGPGVVRTTPSGVIFIPRPPERPVVVRKSVSATARFHRPVRRSAHWQTRVYHWPKHKHR